MPVSGTDLKKGAHLLESASIFCTEAASVGGLVSLRPSVPVPVFPAPGVPDNIVYRLLEAASSGWIERGAELLTNSARPARRVN